MNQERKKEPEEFGVAPALATLYRAALSMATQETQLIWTRYTGFLVLNGFLITAYTETTLRGRGLAANGQGPDPWTVSVIGLLSVLLNAIWHALNFAGWQNMCLLYHRATAISPHLKALTLPTDYFKDRIPTPWGWIYWLAQAVPAGLSFLAAALAMPFGIRTLVSPCLAVGVCLAAWIILATLVLSIEYGLMRRQVESRPL
jgi:hypothetical protein